jgi:hypothetical protein
VRRYTAPRDLSRGVSGASRAVHQVGAATKLSVHPRGAFMYVPAP